MSLPAPAATLSELVALSSPSGGEAPLAHHLAALLAEMGHRPRLQPLPAPGGALNVLVDTGGEGPAWLLAGHTDTVGPAPDWQGDPLRLRATDDGRLVGLGAWDMKAGLVALLAALRAWRPGSPRLKLALLACEEDESQGAEAMVRSGFLDCVAGAVVPEAAPGAPPMGLALTLGRPGRVLLEVTARGRAAHATERRGPVGIVAAAARAALLLERPPPPEGGPLGPPLAMVRSLAAGCSGGLTRPHEATLRVDRLLTQVTAVEPLCERTRATLAQRLPGPRWEVRPAQRAGPWLQPYWLPAEQPLAVAVRAAVAATGGTCSERYDASPADENRIAMAGVPVVSLSAAGGNAHAAGEWVEDRGLRRLCAALVELTRLPPPDPGG